MRYELTDFEWSAVSPFLPNKPRGVPRVNDRRVLDGIFWILRSGVPWRDLPESFGALHDLLHGGQFKANGHSVGIDASVNFGRLPTSRPAHQPCFAPSRATAVLMDADNGSVDHLDGAVMGFGEGLHDQSPRCQPPANERTGCSRSCKAQSSPADRAMVRLTAISRRCR
jgi:Putative transposase of IS4/5 family (DUF4096)